MHEVQGELLWSHFVMKVYQNIHLHQILDKFETGPYEVKN